MDAQKYEQGGGPKKKITPIKVNPNDIEIERTWEEFFMNPTVTNKSSKLMIDESGMLHQGTTPIPKLQRSLSLKNSNQSKHNPSVMKMKKHVKHEEDEEELLTLLKILNEKYEVKKNLREPARHSIDMGSCSNIEIPEDLGSHFIDKRKVVGYKTKTISEPVYEDELNMKMESLYEITGTNPNSIYIPINICIEEYNKYELCAYIDSGCSACFGKRTLFPNFLWKKSKGSDASKNCQ